MYVAAAAKSLQSCPILCDPTDGSPPGSPSPGLSRQERWSGLSFPSPMRESESESEVSQSCPTLSDPMDCSPPGSSMCWGPSFLFFHYPQGSQEACDGEGATPLSSAFRRRNLVPQSYKGPQPPFPKVRRGGFLLPSEALCRSPGLSPRREQRLQGQDSRPQQIRGKTHSGLTPSRPGSGQPPSRSVRSTLGDPLLANKNVLGRNLLGAPGVEFPAALVLPWGLPLSLVPPETCSAL